MINQTFNNFTKFSVRSSISELEAVRIFNLRGKKGYHDGHMDIVLNEPNIIQLKKISERSSLFEVVAVRIFNLRGQKGYHDGHMDILVDIYSCILIN